jgi:hypothetical protein
MPQCSMIWPFRTRMASTVQSESFDRWPPRPGMAPDAFRDTSYTSSRDLRRQPANKDANAPIWTTLPLLVAVLLKTEERIGE